ncbi:universal stress protein [Marivita sp. S0852]|uniref:universal stress protein n=1 Tax=Marivita sp. S0852 TaxID=3373893 RepID=UPI0039824F57
MYKKILVPMALDHGISPQTLEIARVLNVPNGEIIAIHVYEAAHGSVNAFLDEEVVKAGFEHARARMTDKLRGLEGITPALVKGHSSRTIIDYSNQHDIDCIVIGSHKPGLSDFFLGSTAARVVRHAKCAVHVHRDAA